MNFELCQVPLFVINTEIQKLQFDRGSAQILNFNFYGLSVRVELKRKSLVIENNFSGGASKFMTNTQNISNQGSGVIYIYI